MTELPVHAPRDRPDAQAAPAPSGGLFGRLVKTREHLAGALRSVFKGSSKIDERLFEQVEDCLIMADLGADVAAAIVDGMRGSPVRDEGGFLDLLRSQMIARLEGCEAPLEIPDDIRPYVILVVGVNGVGKTTTVAKIGAQLQQTSKSVMFAACDTFRAAATEQLQIWSRRLDIPMVSQQPGADPAAVAHDALSSAMARGTDVLIVDTAGRQHTHSELMAQLAKIRRVVDRVCPGAPHETLLVLDAGTGQNALAQVEQFGAAVPLSAICLTKLDGTAKGGVTIALADRFGLPIRYVGVGEQVADLRPFDARNFVEALVPTELVAADLGSQVSPGPS